MPVYPAGLIDQVLLENAGYLLVGFAAMEMPGFNAADAIRAHDSLLRAGAALEWMENKYLRQVRLLALARLTRYPGNHRYRPRDCNEILHPFSSSCFLCGLRYRG